MSFATANRFYRKPITVSTASATLSGFQKKITISFVSGKMASDFSDLIFEDSLDNNLPYWIENKTDNSSAVVWVKLNTSSSTASTIYMYYGSETPITSPSSIDNTMDTGLRFFYFTGRNFDNFIGTGIDTTPNYGWGSNPVTINGIGGYSDNLSVYWKGWIKPNGLGTTTFYCISDDGQRMYVAVNSSTGFTNIIDNWVDQGDTERSANYNMQGITWFQYNYYENGGGATARIGWDSVNGGKEYPIPSAYLRCSKYLSTEPTLTFGNEEIYVTINYLRKYRRSRITGSITGI